MHEPTPLSHAQEQPLQEVWSLLDAGLFSQMPQRRTEIYPARNTVRTPRTYSDLSHIGPTPHA